MKFYHIIAQDTITVMDRLINEYAAKGWHLHSFTSYPVGHEFQYIAIMEINGQ